MHWVVLAVLIAVAACGQPSAVPDMEAGETGRLVRVIDGDAMVLNTGQSVRLVSIEAPALRPRGRAPDSYAVEASRALAHVVTFDGAGREVWLNREMILRGGARVRLYPDTAARGAELLALEAQARKAGRGLWSESAYQVRAAQDVALDERWVMIVSVVPGQVGDSEDEACVWALKGAALQLEVEAVASVFCEAEVGGAYEVRGWVSNGRLSLGHPLHAMALE